MKSSTPHARTTSSLEPLETRCAPAVLLNATTLRFVDADGDTVIARLSKPLLTAANAPLIFNFDTPFDTAAGQQLREVDLSVLGRHGLGLTLTATRSATTGGDGFVNVGFLDSGGYSLGVVAIDGDLGRFTADAESAAKPVAIASLTAHSVGRYGTSTQSGAGSLVSTVEGAIGSLVVKTNYEDARLEITNKSFVGGSAPGRVTSMKVGGSVLRSTIVASDAITALAIAGDLVGGSAQASGYLQARAIKSLAIGGSIIGGSGDFSGEIFTTEDLGAISVKGSIVGSVGEESGTVNVLGRIGKTVIGGSIFSGAGERSGSLRAKLDLGSVEVGGSLVGTAADPVIISGLTQLSPSATRNLAIGSVLIRGSAIYAEILAGQFPDNSASTPNADAEIGALTVLGDWIASSAAAGVSAGADGVFGTADDSAFAGGNASIASRIGRIAIGGQISGTINAVSVADAFGFAAQSVGALKVGGTIIPVQPGIGNDDFAIGITGDLRLREVA